MDENQKSWMKCFSIRGQENIPKLFGTTLHLDERLVVGLMDKNEWWAVIKVRRPSTLVPLWDITDLLMDANYKLCLKCPLWGEQSARESCWECPPISWVTSFVYIAWHDHSRQEVIAELWHFKCLYEYSHGDCCAHDSRREIQQDHSFDGGESSWIIS